MLKIKFGTMPKLVRNIDEMFESKFKNNWLRHSMVKNILFELDRVVIVGDGGMKSSIHGNISPFELSSKSMLLILAIFEPSYSYYGSYFTESSFTKWLLKLGSIQDVTICYSSLPIYEGNFRIKLLNNNSILKDFEDVIKNYRKFEKQMSLELRQYYSNLNGGMISSYVKN